MPLSLSKCTATGKTRYAEPGEAKKAMSKIKAKRHSYNAIARKRVKHRQGKTEQCRYYYCGFCKGFHLTKVPAQVTIKTIESFRKENSKNNQGLVIAEHEALNWKADSLPFPQSKNMLL